jgi:hypothetical protein
MDALSRRCAWDRGPMLYGQLRRCLRRLFFGVCEEGPISEATETGKMGQIAVSDVGTKKGLPIPGALESSDLLIADRSTSAYE